MSVCTLDKYLGQDDFSRAVDIQMESFIEWYNYDFSIEAIDKLIKDEYKYAKEIPTVSDVVDDISEHNGTVIDDICGEYLKRYKLTDVCDCTYLNLATCESCPRFNEHIGELYESIENDAYGEVNFDQYEALILNAVKESRNEIHVDNYSHECYTRVLDELLETDNFELFDSGDKKVSINHSQQILFKDMISGSQIACLGSRDFLIAKPIEEKYREEMKFIC